MSDRGYTFRVEEREFFGSRTHAVVNVELARTLARFRCSIDAEAYVCWLNLPAQDRGDWSDYARGRYGDKVTS